MTIIAIDGLNEEDFRRTIESDLRHGREATAVDRLRTLLAPFAGPDGILPERFLTVSVDELSLRGWDYLEDCIRRHDRPGRPVTAISIAFGWPGEDLPQVDSQGRLEPLVETGYFNDAAYPFSQSGRSDLLDGYSLHGCSWSADCEAVDNALSLDGIDDLNGALAALEARLLASESPEPDEICAGSLGACLLSVLLFQTVSARIARDGLPRPICVMAGSNGVYPYFDAPVAGMPDAVRKAAAQAEEDEDEELVHAGVPGPRYSSLLMTGIPRAQKRAVLVLAESEDEMAVRIAKLRGLNHAEQVPLGAPIEPQEPQNELETAQGQSDLLLTKKPSGQPWDFRDLLNPVVEEDRIGRSEIPAEEAAVEPQGESGSELEFAAELDLPLDEPVPAMQPPLDQPELAEPGFALLQESAPQTVQHRLQSLLASHAPPAELALATPRSLPYPPEQAGQIWPFGCAGLDTPDLVDSADQPIPDAVPQPAGLWVRLRAWLRR